MDKLLVVGASGLIGSTALQLGKVQFDAYGTYNKNVAGGTLHLDVTERPKVFETIRSVKPDFVIDAHGVHLDYCETHQEEAWRLNVEGSRNVAEASREIGAKYLFLSSEYVFDGEKRAYKESDAPRPINYYGKTKWAAESTLKVLDIDHIIVRTSGVYGTASSTGMVSFVPWVIGNLKKGENTNIISDKYISPTFVDDLCGMIFDLYKNDAAGIFHVVGKDCITRYKFAKLISKEFGLNPRLIKPIKASELKLVAERPRKVRMRTEKLIGITHKQTLGVGEGLKLIHERLGA